jgi:bifunctional DNA-binding transcriptional regulator/antitoxin component of YhaV-PrlF toxin-antitoxin module
MRRKINNRNIRSLIKKDSSYMVTLPVEMVRDLGWRKGQKVEFRKKGKELIIKDWE